MSNKNEDLNLLSSNYTLACPICEKERKYSSKSFFYKSRKHNKPCVSCSNSLKAGGIGIVLYNDKGDKRCIDCKEYKPESEYYKNKSSRTSVCKICSNIRSKRYSKSIYRYSKYGITKEDFNKMMLDQTGKCTICRIKLDAEIHIDHDHSTGNVRSILCGKCNKGLGQFNDDVKILKNAINYLNKHKQTNK